MSDLISRTRAILRANGGRWQALASGVDRDLLARAPAPGEWSALQCLGHAADTEAAVFAARVRAILAGAPGFASYDPDLESTPITGGTDATALAEAHAGLRAESLALLATVVEADLDRSARHAQLGRVTMRELLNEWAGHDLMHVVQAERAIMQEFIPSTGPWRPYFADHDVEVARITGKAQLPTPGAMVAARAVGADDADGPPSATIRALPQEPPRMTAVQPPHRASPLTPDELASIRRPFREARLLPGRAYHDEAFLDFEREEWFFRDWVAVARAEELPDPGSFVVRDCLGESVLLARGSDATIRGFYNVCRHRGTAVEERECGTAVRFQCPYHAWVYDVDGRLVRAKHTEDLEDFSLATFGLTPIRAETWGGWVFLCFAETTPGLEAYLGDWSAHHAGFERDFARLRRAARLEYDVAANWKIVAENYSECYHCPGVHPLLNRLTPYDLGEDFFPGGPWKGGWMVFVNGCETMSIDGQRHGRPLLYARDEVEAGRIYYYILWPNLIVSVHPDYVLTHQVWPDGPGRSKVLCDLYVDAEAAATADVSGAVEFWDITNREDYHVVELQQRGTRSRSWEAGRYSNQEAAVHAFDLMCADRYAMDGVRTPREARTEVANADRRLATRAARGPAVLGGEPKPTA